MNGTINLDVLAKDKVRTAILLTEIGGWLHMLGKMDNRFILSQTDSPKVDYDDLDPCKYWGDVEADLCKALKDGQAQAKMSFSDPQQLKNAPAFLYSFISQHRTYPKPAGISILKLLFDAHGLASGTEKGTLLDSEGKQSSLSTFIANAFGYEGPSENLIQRDLDTLRASVSTKIVETLNDIFSPPPTKTDWSGLHQELKQVLSEGLSLAAGDTRRPANEVTLWDQTVTAASLLKTGLVQNILETNWCDPQQAASAKKYQWRLLRVYYNGLAFITNAHHPSDLLGRWSALQEAQRAVRQLLEIKYPLAAEAYSDEDNLVFVVPNISDLLSAQFNDGTTDTLKQRIQKVFASKLKNEIEPQVMLSDPSRGAINLGKTIAKKLPSPQPQVQALRDCWEGDAGKGKEPCTVCRVRPIPSKEEAKADKQKEKANNRNVCVVCLERRDKRSKIWAEKKLSDTTVWIDEAADNNGRVALIAGKFDLSRWLDTSYLDSLMGRKSPFDNSDFCIRKFFPLVADFAANLNNQALTTGINDCLRGTKLLEGLNKEFPGGVSPVEIYNRLTSERKGLTALPDLSSDDSADYERAARLIFQGFFAKTKSFARLRRIWETTGEFWNQAKAALGEPAIVGRQKYRLIVQDQQGQLSTSIGPSHVYDVRIGKVETSFVYDGARLISADNLRYLAKQLELKLPDDTDDGEVAKAVKQRLEKEAELKLFEKPSRQEGLVRTPQIKATVSNFNVEIKQHDYSPVIPLLAEPQIFIALVPADKAMKVITHMRDEYEKRMSKVRNRLPLHLNLLTFNRRLPLYVAMDAVRRMLDRKTNSAAQWRVTEIENFDDSAGKFGKHATRISLSPTSGNSWISQQITAKISYNLGDDSKDKDFYYPYFFVAQANEDQNNGGKPLTERPHHWQAIHPTHIPTAAHGFTDLVHVSELCKDDLVLYSPSTFDFEHLDVAGRRFELNYRDESGVRIASANRLHPVTRPFLLEEIADLETVWEALKKLPGGQRDSLVRLIETKRIEWKVETADDATLCRFALDTLKQTGSEQEWWTKKIDVEQRGLLKAWAANGKLADALELYEKMMKLESNKEQTR